MHLKGGTHIKKKIVQNGKRKNQLNYIQNLKKEGRQRETKKEDIIYPSFCVVFSSTVFVLLFFFLYNRIWLLLHTCPLQIAPNLKVILVNDFLTQFYSKSGRPEIVILFVQKKKKRHFTTSALVIEKPVNIFLRF